MLLFAWFVSFVAVAADPPVEAEKYLLGDLGVKVDLPKGWEPTLWADWELKADSPDRAVALYAWSTAGQTVPAEADLPHYAAHFEEQMGKYGLGNTKATETKLVDMGGTPVVRATLGFTLQGGKGTMYAASYAIENNLFHIGVIAANPNAKKASKAFEDILGKLEFRKPPLPVDDGGIVESQGIKVDLPAGWRKPTDYELEEAVVSVANTLPVNNLDGCNFAFHPRGPMPPAILVTCQGGFYMGIVDEFTFADKDRILKPVLFGEAPVPPAEQIQASDRTAFLYTAELQGKPLIMAVAPYDQGIARMWVTGGEDAEFLKASAREAMKGTSFSGEHPAGPEERLGYWLMYRTTSPQTLGGLCGCCCLATGVLVVVGVIVMRPKKKKEEWG
jgi:hypothetical protein